MARLVAAFHDLDRQRKVSGVDVEDVDDFVGLSLVMFVLVFVSFDLDVTDTVGRFFGWLLLLLVLLLLVLLLLVLL